MSIFKRDEKNEWLEAMREIRELREALRRTENKLAATNSAALSTIFLLTDDLKFAEVFRKKAEDRHYDQ